MEWDGCDYDNDLDEEDPDFEIFDEVYQDNVMVIASVFDSESDKSDETTGTLAGVNTDPKKHDVYFGDETPPPKVISNQTSLSFTPSYILEWNTTYYWKIVTWDKQDNKTESPIFNFTTRDNHAPYIPSNPIPMHNSTEVPIKVNLSWTGGDPDNDTTYYDVYFGLNFPPDKLVNNITNSYYDVGILQFGTRYYWNIVAWDRWGYSSHSENWTFLTQPNRPPNEPSNPQPPDGGKDVPIQANLSWKGGDPNIGDIVSYKIYFEEDNPDPQENIATIGPYNASQKEIIFDIPEDLEILKTYYWKIKSVDSKGLTTEGDVWSFSTGLNYPPSRPTITGDKEGKVGVDYNHTFSSVDPEGSDVSYFVKWDDGTDTGWVGPYPSGQAITLSHNWTTKGTYIISAKAKDQYGQVSQESTYKVTRPKSKQWIYLPLIQFIYNIIQRFPLLEKLLSFFPIFYKILNL